MKTNYYVWETHITKPFTWKHLSDNDNQYSYYSTKEIYNTTQ
jgi:hypothetical protein